jgi:hypothetical protein
MSKTWFKKPAVFAENRQNQPVLVLTGFWLVFGKNHWIQRVLDFCGPLNFETLCQDDQQVQQKLNW